MNKPKEPNIYDFGISPKDRDKAEKFINIKEEKIYKIWIILGPLIYLIVALILIIDFRYELFGTIVLLILLIPAVLTCCMFIQFIFLTAILELIYLIIYRKERKYFTSVTKYEKEIEEYNRHLYMLKYEYWASLSGHRFEEEVSNLLRNFFDKVIHTKGSGDDGIDIIIKENGEDVPIQCKAHKQKIGPAPVRELLGVMVAYNYSTGIIITVNGASSNAQNLAKENNVKIWDASHLISFQEKVLLN